MRQGLGVGGHGACMPLRQGPWAWAAWGTCHEVKTSHQQPASIRHHQHHQSLLKGLVLQTDGGVTFCHGTLV